jgi:Na+/proline symporter
MFFGALLSAIKSCASATLLAPSVTFTENILRPMMDKMSDHELLRLMRIVTLSFTVLVTLYAMNSRLSIFKMVENAYQITLVMAFIPLACGVYWKRATNQGALLSIFLGLTTWLAMLIAGPEDPFLPPQFAGLIASAFGMVVGSLLPTCFGHEVLVEPHDYLHEHAAQTHTTAHPHHHN